MANFLAFGHSVAPETIYQSIYKLLPGHYLIAHHSEVRITRYWDVGEEPQLPNGSILNEHEYARRILELLDDSVRRRMVADVPLGAFLSGGVDSSAVVASMKRHSVQPVKTFSLGFDIGGGYYNELSDARIVAKHLGTEHHELHAEHVDLLQTLRLLVYHYDEPFADPAAFPLYLLSRFAREHVKVVLSGDGGDELFGGYHRYALDRFAPFYRKLPAILTKNLIPALTKNLPSLRRNKHVFETLRLADPARRYVEWLTIFSPEMQAELLKVDLQEAVAGCDLVSPYYNYYHALNSKPASDHLNRLMYVDLKTGLVDGYMEKLDKATMACGLEARVPLLDYRLVELAFQIPGRFKIRGRSWKRVFKRAVRELLPVSVLRKPKHGFAVPLDPWFRGELKDFSFQVLLDDRTLERGYFNKRFIERLWREHVKGCNVWTGHLWILLNFELWHRVYLDDQAV